MNFKEALEALHRYEKVRRPIWPDMIHLELDTKTSFEENNTVLVEEEIKAYRQECVLFQYNNGIFLSNDWIIEGDEENQVSFADAILALQARKKARLSTWDNNTYIQTDNLGRNIYMRTMTEYPFVPLYTDLIATDWEVL